MDHGPQTMDHRSWTTDHGSRTMVRGPWSMVHRPRTMDHVQNLRCRCSFHVPVGQPSGHHNIKSCSTTCAQKDSGFCSCDAHPHGHSGVGQIWKDYGERPFFRSRRFWKAVWRLRKRKWPPPQAVLGLVEELDLNYDIVGLWMKHFEDLLYQVSMTTYEEAESEDSGENSLLQWRRFPQESNSSPRDRTPGVDESHPEMMKALEVVGCCR